MERYGHYVLLFRATYSPLNSMKTTIYEFVHGTLGVWGSQVRILPFRPIK